MQNHSRTDFSRLINERLSYVVPDAIVPELPYSWDKLPSFVNDFERSPFALLLNDGSRPFPRPAYAWWESLNFYLSRALNDQEVVPLVDLVREYGRFSAASQAFAIRVVNDLLRDREAVFRTPSFDLNRLYSSGVVESSFNTASAIQDCLYFRVPEEYMKYLPPVLSGSAGELIIHVGDTPIPIMANADGLCCIILNNSTDTMSKLINQKKDGIQLFVNALWKEGRLDLFDIPIFCHVDYLCFRVIVAPLQMWLKDEDIMLNYSVCTDQLEFVLQTLHSDMFGTSNITPVKELYFKNLPASFSSSACLYPLQLWPRRQKLVPVNLSHLVSVATPSDTILDQLTAVLNDFENNAAGSPILLRSILREHKFRVRHLGRLLLRLRLPVVKQIIVNEMLGRRIKWHIRSIQMMDFQNNRNQSANAAHWVDILANERNAIHHLSSHSSDDFHDLIVQSASLYFQVPVDEITPFVPTSLAHTFFHTRVCPGNILTAENRSLFPHARLLLSDLLTAPAIGNSVSRGCFYPTLSTVYPQPPRVVLSNIESGIPSTISVKQNPIDALPLLYAASVFNLEMHVAIGDLIGASVALAKLAKVLLRMREIEPLEVNKEPLRLRSLALGLKSREFTPSFLPPISLDSILETIVCSEEGKADGQPPPHDEPNPFAKYSIVFDLYQEFRKEIGGIEPQMQSKNPDNNIYALSLLGLDCATAKALANSGQHAVPILIGCCSRSEKYLGARHPVTVSSWVRLGQAIKKYLEKEILHVDDEDTIGGVAATNQSSGVSFNRLRQIRLSLLREGITCLNKAKQAASLNDPVIPVAGLLDHGSLVHYLLSIFYLWNGESAKALNVSREGLLLLESNLSKYHPRYLNSAFLHAKLLEYQAAIFSTDPVASTNFCREAVDVLEDVLSSLIELTDEAGKLREQLFAFDEFLGGYEQFQQDIDMKRKLAVTALILKLNIWLLNDAVARDMLDLIVCTDLEGQRGVAELPSRNSVREAVVCELLKKSDNGATKKAHQVPVLEMSSVLPKNVLIACQQALVAKSNNQPVSVWLFKFIQLVSMSFGNPRSSHDMEILKDLFLTFIYIQVTEEETIWIGPLASPLVPRNRVGGSHSTEYSISRKMEIYRKWEQSSALYCMDHSLGTNNDVAKSS